MPGTKNGFHAWESRVNISEEDIGIGAKLDRHPVTGHLKKSLTMKSCLSSATL